MKARFYLDAASFHRLNVNAAVLGSKATTSFYVDHNHNIYVYSGDGQLYIQDWTQGNFVAAADYDDIMWVQDYATTKAIVGHLDKVEGDMSFQLTEKELLIDELELQVSANEMISEANLLSKFKTFGSGEMPFAINADRLRKLSLLHPRDYPVDFLHVHSNVTGAPILLFRKGPHLRGAYSLLDRSLIAAKDGSRLHLWG